MFATNSRIPLDYICQPEATTRYVRRNPARYAHIPGYADHPSKRDIVYSFGEVERVSSEGWHAVLGRNTVHVFGDLDKMTRDLTMLLMSDDLEGTDVVS